MKQGSFKHRSLAINITICIFSVVLVLFLIEVSLRIRRPYSSLGAGIELTNMRSNPQDLTKTFTVDPDLGFRPILGNSKYNDYGTKCNSYRLEKNSGVSRLLFIGDSVTARGTLIDALKEIYQEDEFEYWNAGVESFNTVQEVEFYKEYNSVIKPDHVILTLHNNDFATTPVAFLNSENKIVVYVPNKPLTDINRWLFIHSYIYRYLLGASLGWTKDQASVTEEVQVSLRELRDILASDNISFTVLVLPVIKQFGSWSPEEKKAREDALGILVDLDIQYFDLNPALQNGIAEGIINLEPNNDSWHPSPDVSIVFAEYLFDNSFLLSPKRK